MNDQLISLQTEELDGRVVVRLRGEIDLSNIRHVQQQLERAVDDSPRIVVDLVGIDYLDSQGLRLIKHLRDKADGSGGDFVVVAPRDSFVRQVLEMSRLTEYVRIRDALEE